MNLYNSSFLCLDIGTYGVRGIAHNIHNAKIVNSATYFVKNTNTIFALKSVIDELEHQLKTNFNSAFVTGNFGDSDFQTFSDTISWNNEHKITEIDLHHQTAKISTQDGFFAMHIIPVFYSTPKIKNIGNTPIGHIDTQLKSIFSIISYEEERIKYISDIMRRSHIQCAGFFDSAFLQNAILRKPKEKVLFLDLGNEFTTVSIWTDRGPLYFNKIKFGQNDITKELMHELNIGQSDADTLKISVANALPNEMDRFTPADSSEKFSNFSRADINDVFIPTLSKLINTVIQESDKYIQQYKPEKIILSGGGTSIENINTFIEHAFGLPVENQTDGASVNALSEYIWQSHLSERNAYLERQTKFKNYFDKFINIFHRKKKVKKHKFIPIMPSTLCFNMNDYTTYTMFASAGISMIHVDIMDGFYVDRIAGGIKDLANIRSKTKAHLHVHLMTESPSVWATDAINAGADTVIISTNTSGVHDAINIIKNAGKRCGIAINPDSNIDIIVPVLKQLDEVMVMAVKPGAAGQEFDDTILHKIQMLNHTRKKHGLKYIISVDGGINPETAKLCWNAGADLLVSGSYLAKSSDFPLAVQSLLKH
ncbi:MAG: ribulose-phosphate 3-epimerase [Alphaproteobacteria bacterium]|nr:ribulose-phosphate 3-epimerase [Alphaproteobacteria bacterium]